MMRLVSYISSSVINLHYARIVEKISMPLLAAALESGSQISDELRPRAMVWEFKLELGELPKRYIGGYWSKGTGPLPYSVKGSKVIPKPAGSFSLDLEGVTFFGLEEKIFRKIAAQGRSKSNITLNLPQFPDPGPFYSAISTLRDGSIVAPSKFFVPVEAIEY